MTARTPEGAVKTGAKRLLVDEGVYYFMPPGTGYGRAGIPDIVCCVRGRFLAIECKAGKGKTTALQDRELLHIVEAGGYAVVLREDGLDGLRELIQQLKELT
jgi:Holliday junction resolvase